MFWESTEFHLVRHGQTDWNVERRWQGVTDIPLNSVGRRQALGVASALSGIEIGRVISSDLARARQTAEEIARVTGVDVETTSLLRERSFGRWEGFTREEIAERFPGDIEAYAADPVHFRPEGGQSWEEFAERAAKALGDLVLDIRVQRVVLVAHAGPIQAFVSNILGMPYMRPSPFSIDNGSLSTVREQKNVTTGQPRRVVTALNITGHLRTD